MALKAGIAFWMVVESLSQDGAIVAAEDSEEGLARALGSRRT